jgi:hypothetical protein
MHQNLDAHWCRLTTKWGDGPRIKRKEQLQVSPAFQLRTKWNMEAHFPDLEGCDGGRYQPQRSSGMLART